MRRPSSPTRRCRSSSRRSAARAAANGVDIYFGASVGGGIPIIRVVREALSSNDIESIHGILNGTCNYILTRMEREGAPFDAVLKDAQRLGYAEADPSLDIDGFDTAHKACILTALAYGFQPTLEQVQVEGIRSLDGIDVKYAADFGCRIKLLAVVAKDGDEVEVGVHPTLIPFSHMLASVNDAFNAAMVKGDMSDYTMYYGRGAGRAPTASTVVGDIGDIARNLAPGETRYARGVPDYADPRQARRLHLRRDAEGPLDLDRHGGDGLRARRRPHARGEGARPGGGPVRDQGVRRRRRRPGPAARHLTGERALPGSRAAEP